MNFESPSNPPIDLGEALAVSALDGVFWTPTRIGSMSAWWGHVPFAHWLVSVLKPNTIVELGTHNGVSFAAFCEAVQRSRLSGRCYAVDTWEGDEQAGWYGGDVFEHLSAFMRARYAAFAELLRMKFDEALPFFPDGSIDLLHIDGLHTYEAVKHDFDSWLPKLSARGVVLFHDTNVRERSFGVWKLWGEVRELYPSFEFLHAHGLGVAAVGANAPRAVIDLCATTPETAGILRERLAQLGARWVLGEQLADLKQHAQNLENERTTLVHSLDDYKAHSANLETDRRSLNTSLAEIRSQIKELEADRSRIAVEVGNLTQESDVRATDLAVTRRRLSVAEQQRTALAEQLEGFQARHEAVEAHAESLKQRIAVLGQEHVMELDAVRQAASAQELALRGLAGELSAVVHSLHASTSWRVTRPLRGIKKVSRLLLGNRPALISPSSPSSAAPEDVSCSVTAPASANHDPQVEVIANSRLFDEGGYAGADAARAMNKSPIAHYLQEGEAAGLAPSALFDPVFYKRRYPDVVGQVPNVLLHYILDGRREGREALPVTATLSMPTDRIRADRSTVVVVVHEATRTGAPILAWNIVGELKKRYNVVVLLRKGGPIADALASQSDGTVTLPDSFVVHEAQSEALAKAFDRAYAPLYVIANSVESRYFVSAFERAGLPVIALIHEFSSSVRPRGALHGLFEITSKIVFPANVVAEAAVADYEILKARAYEVLPQGVSSLPPGGHVAHDEQRKIVMTDLAPLPPGDGSLLVVGIGTITTRKGVEFFIAAAASVQRHNPARRVHFLWVGDAYWFDEAYLESLREQVTRSGVGSSFGFAGEFEDLAPVYARADVFFLPSRLDPLPNVTIDAALHGIPVICFEQASGCAEILAKNARTRELVVPYMDAEAAARLVITLAANDAHLKALGEGMRVIAREHFDMGRYVDNLDRCGRAAVAAHQQTLRDAVALADDNAFNAALYLGPLAATVSRSDAVSRYLHASRLAVPRGKPETGRLVRRPLEGFHPLIYAAVCDAFDETIGEDPLVHFLRSGRPDGPWKHQVIRADTERVTVATSLRIVVHGHFHYPELLEDFVIRLRRNRTQPDLVLTTTSSDRAEVLQSIVDRMDVSRATIAVTPNRGRDIAPMLTAFGKEQFAGYDLVGHFHGKRSPHVDASIGTVWRNFTWEHLVGGDGAMMDAVVTAMASDDVLGLVFPEDPHLNGWDRNLPMAEDLAARMGIEHPLPTHFDFPIGTMFWARVAALQPLQALGIEWDDFPPEPLPIDGSMLHALERLLPFSARMAGYQFATTLVEGCVR